MSAPKLEGGPGDGAEIWRQWHFALTDIGVDLRLDEAPDTLDNAAMTWSFAADSLLFLTMALRQLSEDELRAKVQSILDDIIARSVPHDPSVN